MSVMDTIGDFTLGKWFARKFWQGVNWVSSNALTNPIIQKDSSPLVVTVRPREVYGPPVPPTTASKATSLTAWNFAAIALVILALGYLTKNISAFLR